MVMLMFCKECGHPKQLPSHVLATYVCEQEMIYCDECDYGNEVTEELKQAAQQVKKELGQ